MVKERGREEVSTELDAFLSVFLFILLPSIFFGSCDLPIVKEYSSS